MNQQARTIEQVVLGLAERMKPCPDVILADAMGSVFMREGIHVELGYRPLLDTPHQTCHGTGQVPEFPMLREPCWVTGWAPWNHEDCKECQGRGWLPVLTTDELLEAGKPYHFQVWWDGSLWRVYSNVFRRGKSEGANYSSEDKQMALALALEAALKQEAK